MKTLLYLLANGVLEISYTLTGIAATASYSKSTRRWGYQLLAEPKGFSREEFEKIFFENPKKQRQLLNALAYIRRRRFATLKKKKGSLVLEITEHGKRRALFYHLDQLHIVPPDVWDEIWRVVLFDIPEKYRIGRDLLRKKLRDLGFLQLQKSAFVLPYPCWDEIDFIVQAYHLIPYVTFFEAPSLGYQEAKALAHFSLKPPQQKK